MTVCQQLTSQASTGSQVAPRRSPASHSKARFLGQAPDFISTRLFGAKMRIALAESSVGNRRSGLRARAGHYDCNHHETLASLMLQPTTCDPGQNHVTNIIAAQAGFCEHTHIMTGETWHKTDTKCWNCSSLS
jgi:hypothetical protein